MRIYFDTEFMEDGRTIELISIGMVREDGRTYYAENSEADLTKADAWVTENVIPLLKGEEARKTRAEIAADVLAFVGREPEFWTYFSEYNWVTLRQLFGRMTDLPKGWPMYCRDLKQFMVERGNPPVPDQAADQHNALSDAIWTMHTHFMVENKFVRVSEDFVVEKPEEDGAASE